jgi:hypothetical protein
MPWRKKGARLVGALLVAALVISVIGSCGSGAIEGSDDEASDEGGGEDDPGRDGGGAGDDGGRDGSGAGDDGGGGGSGGAGGDDLEWGLPLGPLSVDSYPEKLVYNELWEFGCTAGEMKLNEMVAGTLPRLGGAERLEADIGRSVLLFQSAIQLCRGDQAGGRRLFDEAEATYGWEGVEDFDPDCLLYRAIRTVLEQRFHDPDTCEAFLEPEGETTPSSDPEPPVSGESTTESTGESTTESTIEPTTESTAEPGSGGEGTAGERGPAGGG